MVVIEEIKAHNNCSATGAAEVKNTIKNKMNNDEKSELEELNRTYGKSAEERDSNNKDKEEEDEDDDESEEEKGNEEGSSVRTKQSRGEKKARSAIIKLGLKPVPGVVSVRLRRDKNFSFVLKNPEVFKCTNSDTYVIFGDIKPEDVTAQTRAQMAEKFTKKMAAAAGGSAEVGEKVAEGDRGEEEIEKEAYIEEEEEKGEENTEGLEEKDIHLIMSQTSCSRAKAISALRKHNNDIVEAIMQLTS